ncbi:Hsp20/alpha crystallin family protein [Paenibacillus sp. GD4]|jgi:HSP20 family molecular chaperone IbpA|uniref:Hsp20/alpha crystallin family protein n=1 Tax=Paenibacillus sp. GD4 TaxID=3068890 RepID=UPI002796C3E8|nr:Hsp20/alpha crystallin family protein [Paenibacillus sp. GD4]MDQ1913055.1 Hsp20/alpha crystallin family protein [Paenibacillus sp. GD4]
MADGNKSNGNPYGTFDWKQFEQFFGGKLPFAPGGSGKGEGLAWIQEYVQDVMKQALPSVSNAAERVKNHLHTETFETHNNVIVKIHVPDRDQARKIRVGLSVNAVRLTGLPDKKEQTIRLHRLIYPDSCKAVYRDGIIQLHMRKHLGDHTFRDIDVRYY